MNTTPANLISENEARTLQNNWVQTRAKSIQDSLGYEDTREFWFSVAELEEFLSYVKDLSAEQGAASPGVRIYFGSYTEEPTTNAYAAVFLAPTKKINGNNGNNYEIQALNKGQAGVPPVDY